jgi:uroporphyrinogen-III synthase
LEPYRKKMRVLITRALEDAEESARLLVLRGHQGLVAPLLTVRFFDGPDVALDDVQAILATSANGVRALARRSPRRDVALFAVGPQTARAAERLGFQKVKSADGDADALALAAARWAAPGKGALLQVAELHVTGGGNDGKLAQNLPGFTVRREILYAMTGAEKMPDAAARALRAGELDAALFYSPRSASVFRDCARNEKENLPLENLLAACISPATAAALSPLSFRAIRAAARPNQEALLELLG